MSDNHDKPDEQQDNEISPAASQVKVADAETLSLWQRKSVWVFLGGVCLLIAWIALSSDEKPTGKQHQGTQFHQTLDNESAEMGLSANLAKLHQGEKGKATSPSSRTSNATFFTTTPSTRFTQRVVRPATNTPTSQPPLPTPNTTANHRQLAMRRNMPSMMYTATPPQGLVTHQGVTVTQATFVGQDGLSRFGNSAPTTQTVKAQRLPHPEVTVAEGELLHGVLETPINSDLPGKLRAVVTQPIYAYVGSEPLIPAGARLIGQYAAMVRGGQTRVFVMWHRLILPNGISVAINSPGADRLGQAGLKADKVDTHFFARFGHASLLSVIGAGVANVGVSANDRYNSASAYRQAIADAFQQSAEQSLSDSSDIKNTLHVYQGQRITVFVAKDVSFFSVLGHSS